MSPGKARANKVGRTTTNDIV